MKKKISLLLVFLGMMFAYGSSGYAIPAVDIVQTPTDYFVPTDAQKYDSPYYRWYNQDWGWTHGAIGTLFSTATLSISAFDVDNEPGQSDPEKDIISAFKTGTGWVALGELAGASDIWSYTTFNLDSSWFADINSGLQVFMDIDSTHTEDFWAVTLAKSVLSLDEGTLPTPSPGAIPEPATILLVGSGLVGLAGYARKRFKK